MIVENDSSTLASFNNTPSTILYVILNMKLQTMKKFYLVWYARQKISKSVIATDATLHHTYMRQTDMIY
jgi:hypothetical protein